MSLLSTLTDERSQGLIPASFLIESTTGSFIHFEDALRDDDASAAVGGATGGGGGPEDDSEASFQPAESAAIARWRRDELIKDKEAIKLFLRDAKYNIFYLPKGKKVLTPAEKERAAKRIDLICRKNNDSHVSDGADKQLVASVLNYKLVLNDREARLEKEVFADYNNEMAIQALIKKANELSLARLEMELAKRGDFNRAKREQAAAAAAEEGKEEHRNLAIDERLLAAKRNRENLQQKQEQQTLDLVRAAAARHKRLKRCRRLRERETALQSPACRWMVIIKAIAAFKIIGEFAGELKVSMEANKKEWKACIKIQRWYLKLRQNISKVRRIHLGRGSIVENLRKRLSQKSLDADAAKETYLARVGAAGLIVDFCRQIQVSLRVVVQSFIGKVKAMQRRIRHYQAATAGRYAILHMVFDRFVSHLRNHIDAVITSGLGLDMDKLTQANLNIITRKCCKADPLRVIQAMQTAEFHRFIRGHSNTFRNALKIFPGGRFSFDIELKKKALYEAIFEKRREHKDNIDVARQSEAAAKSFIPEISIEDVRAFLCDDSKDPLVRHLTQIEKRKEDDEKRIAILKAQNINTSESKPWDDMIHSLTPQEMTMIFFLLVEQTEAEHLKKEKEQSSSHRKQSISNGRRGSRRGSKELLGVSSFAGSRRASRDLGTPDTVGTGTRASLDLDALMTGNPDIGSFSLSNRRGSGDFTGALESLFSGRRASRDNLQGLSVVVPSGPESPSAARQALSPRSPPSAKPSKAPPQRASIIAAIPLAGHIKY